MGYQHDDRALYLGLLFNDGGDAQIVSPSIVIDGTVTVIGRREASPPQTFWPCSNSLSLVWQLCRTWVAAFPYTKDPSDISLIKRLFHVVFFLAADRRRLCAVIQPIVPHTRLCNTLERAQCGMVRRKDEGEKVKPRTKRAKRILEKREPKLVCQSSVPRMARSMTVLSCLFLVLKTSSDMTGRGSEDSTVAAWQQN